MIELLELLADDRLGAESSIMLTYEMDLPLYDGWLRRKLVSAGIANQIVFCDLDVYARELSGLSAARHCGRSYSLVPIHQARHFHPKVYLLLGRQRGRLLIGSGNLTLGGLLRNAELFGVFDYDTATSSGPHPAFRTVADWLSEIGRASPGVTRHQLDRALSWAKWLDRPPVGDNRRLLIGGPGRSPLFDQIAELLGPVTPNSVTVLSASFDRRLDALQQLAKLASSGLVRCVVQLDNVTLDGKAVERLRGAVEWYPFVDPYPKGKRRSDARAHAKLIVLDCGSRELVVYGSANTSRPALLDEDGNAEVVVAFWEKAGATITRLGLHRCFERPRIDDALRAKRWPDDDEPPGTSYRCVLSGAVAHKDTIHVYSTAGVPPATAFLEVAEGVGGATLVRGALKAGKPGEFTVRATAPEIARVARIATAAGKPLSNYVVLSSPALAELGGRSGVGQRTQDALAAMQDGVVLGTVLFELLNQYRDFEVILGRPRRANAGPRAETDDHDEQEPAARPAAAYYTDAGASENLEDNRIGDRADLDLLAALVQPLRVDAKRPLGRDPGDEEDDSALDEEAERREIDKKHGRATGDERRTPSFASQEALERAGRRLVKRLERNAEAIEHALDRRSEVAPISTSALARQIWMPHIAAFLAERPLPTDDGGVVVALESRAFAQYVVRVCKALAGGRDGGVLALVDPKSWEGHDGATLKRGLAFLWTCCLWAAAYLESEPDERENQDGEDGDEDEGHGESWGQWAGLIATRFTATARPLCERPDMGDIERRLPACRDTVALRRMNQRCVEMARRIRRVEQNAGPARRTVAKLENVSPGALVFNASLGVTLLVGTEPPDSYKLLDLSRNEKPIRTFVAEKVIGLKTE